MGEPLDVDKLIGVCGRFGSDYAGERAEAARLSTQLLQRAGVTWSDVLSEGRVATEACRQLLAMLEERDLRIAELERQVPDWQPVIRIEIENHNRSARWLTDLNHSGQVWFSPKEKVFLGNCVKWVGPMPPAMRERLQEICSRTAQRTGLVPPP